MIREQIDVTRGGHKKHVGAAPGAAPAEAARDPKATPQLQKSQSTEPYIDHMNMNMMIYCYRLQTTLNFVISGKLHVNEIEYT